MEENEELKEAVEKVYQVSEEEKMLYIAELKAKAIQDEQAVYDLGVDDGDERRKKAVAKKLLKKKMPIEEIMEVAELSEEEIQKIKKEME